MAQLFSKKESDSSLEAPAKIVWALAWPAVALNSLQTINSLLDTFFIGHLPTENLTALGSAISVLFLFYSMTMALGTAATALVSRFFGAEQHSELIVAAQKSLGLGLTVGVALGAICWPASILASTFLLPGHSDGARQLMQSYLGIFGLGLPAIFVIQILAGSLRGIGDTKSPMVISGIQILLHIVLNALLINKSVTIFGFATIKGLGLGLSGAAIALSVSGLISAVIYLFWARKTPLGNTLKCFWPGLEWARRILKIAVPAAMMSVVRVLSLMAFTSILSQVPNAEFAIGALRPSFSIEALAFMPAFGLAISASALVGQSLGMDRPDRAEKLAWTAAHHGAMVSLLMSSILFVTAEPVARALIQQQPSVVPFVAQFLRIICITEVFFAYGMVFVGAMQGAGDTVRPLWITLISMWGLRVPLAFLFAIVFRLGADGCWIAMSLTQAIHGFLAIFAFKRGVWKLQTV